MSSAWPDRKRCGHPGNWHQVLETHHLHHEPRLRQMAVVFRPSLGLRSLAHQAGRARIDGRPGLEGRPQGRFNPWLVDKSQVTMPVA
jgi:hypothetical protein